VGAATHRSCDCLRQRTFGSADIQTTNRVSGRRASATVASAAVVGLKSDGFARAVVVRGNPAGVAPAHPTRTPAYGGTRKLASVPSMARKGSAAFSTEEVA